MTRRTLFAAIAGLFGAKAAPTPIRGGAYFHGAPTATAARLLIGGDGKLSAHALAKLSKWGLSVSDFNISEAIITK